MMMANAIGAQSMMASGRNVVLVGCSFHVYQNGFKAIFSAGSVRYDRGCVDGRAARISALFDTRCLLAGSSSSGPHENWCGHIILLITTYLETVHHDALFV